MGENKIFEDILIYNRLIFLFLRMIETNILFKLQTKKMILVLGAYCMNIIIYFLRHDNNLNSIKIVSLMLQMFAIFLDFNFLQFNEKIFLEAHLFQEHFLNCNDSSFIIKSGKKDKICFMKGDLFPEYAAKQNKFLSITSLNEMFIIKKQNMLGRKNTIYSKKFQNLKDNFKDFNIQDIIEEFNCSDNRLRKNKFKVFLKKNPENSFLLKIRKTIYNKICFFVCNLVDNKEQEENKLFKRMIESNNRFLCSFSHELKTPINGIIPILENLTSIHKESSHLLKLSVGNLKMLHNTIDNIINFYLFDSNQIFLNLSSFPLKTLIEEIESIVNPMTQLKKITSNIIIQEKLEVTKIETDYQKLKQILLNLLSNAIQFTSVGGNIFFKIEKSHDEKDPLQMNSISKNNDLKIAKVVEKKSFQIKFTVQDDGIGMDEEKLNKLRDKLKYDDTHNNQINSTGSCLGLIVSQRLAYLLGEEDGLRIESKNQIGSTFDFVVEVKNRLINEEKRPSNASAKNFLSSTKINTIQIEERKFLTAWCDIPLNSINIDFEEKLHCDYNFHAKTKFILEAQKTIYSKKTDRLKSLNSVTEEKKNTQIDSNLTLPVTKKCQCPEVLAVDDDAFNLLSLETILNSLNIKCTTVFDGKEAIKKLLEMTECIDLKCQGYKIIFMDYQMPIMDGVESTKKIIELIKLNQINNVPIIGCTAFVSKDQVYNCLNAGMKEILFKPMSKNMIKMCLEKWTNFYLL